MFSLFIVCQSVWAYARVHLCAAPTEAMKGIKSPGAGVAGLCEGPDLDFGIWALVLVMEL